MITYKNGTYQVTLLEDGTKIRENAEGKFIPDFPESIDIKITNKCNQLCPVCHEASTPLGEHAELDVSLVKSLPEGIELAIGGGNPLEHPNLLSFLMKLKEKNIIANMTISQPHFMENFSFVENLMNAKLIYGLGISPQDDPTQEFIDRIEQFPNAVLHFIYGYHDLDFIKSFYNTNLKALFLGFKIKERGKKLYASIGEFIKKQQIKIRDNLLDIINNFKIVSFDNLAIEQGNIKEILPAFDWGSMYMGKDGQYSFYIDLVKKEFAISSTSEERFLIEDKTVNEMFNTIRTNYKIQYD